MGGGSAGLSLTTIEDNYFIKGPGMNWQDVRLDDDTIELQFLPITPAPPFTGGNKNFSTFLKGNFYDYNKDGVLNGEEIISGMGWEDCCSGDPVFLSSRPEVFPNIELQMDAQKAYEWVVENVGASFPTRDQVDKYLIEELTSLGVEGTIIQDERDTDQFPLGGTGEVHGGEKPLDTDGDGIPDSFEKEHGLDMNDPIDATKIASNGYTNIENYAFSLVVEDSLTAKR